MKHDGGRGIVRPSRGEAFDWYVRVRVTERDASFMLRLLEARTLEGEEAVRAARWAAAIRGVLDRSVRVGTMDNQ